MKRSLPNARNAPALKERATAMTDLSSGTTSAPRVPRFFTDSGAAKGGPFVVLIALIANFGVAPRTS